MFAAAPPACPALPAAARCRRRARAMRAQASADAGEAVQLPRRALLAGLLATSVGATAPASRAATSPYNDVLPEVGVLNGRLLPCKSTFNCVSTSSKNADQYTSPWTAPVATPAAAGDAIIDAVRASCPGAELVSSEALPAGQYLRFHVPGVSGRNFSGDEKGGLLVTLRSIAGTVQYVYPFMTPLSDGGLQKSRADKIRQQLAWRLVGCELVECYSQ